MKTLQKKSTILAIALFFTIAAIAQSNNSNQGGRNQGRQGYSQKSCDFEKNNQRMANYLELTAEQTDQIESIRLTHQKKMLPSKNELGEKKAKMQTLSSAENADMKAINSLIDEMSSIKAQMMKEKASHRQEVRKILTEEQRIKFDLHQQNKGKGRGNGSGKCYR